MSCHYSTHGFRTTQTDDKNVMRSVEVVMFPGGSYAVTFGTKFPDDSEELVTQINLSTTALNMLAQALVMAQHHMWEFPHKEAI